MTTPQPAPGGQMPVGQPDPFGPQAGQPVPPKRSKLAWLKFAIPVLVVALSAGVFAVKYFTGTDGAKVGDCLAVSEFTSKADPKQADCAGAEANVKVAAKVDENAACPDGGKYDEYSQSGRLSYKLCLMVNVKSGECLANFTSESAGYKKVPCSDPTKDVEFVKVVDGQTNEAVCEGTEATHTITYVTPPTTMCIKKAGA